MHDKKILDRALKEITDELAGGNKKPKLIDEGISIPFVTAGKINTKELAHH